MELISVFRKVATWMGLASLLYSCPSFADVLELPLVIYRYSFVAEKDLGTNLGAPEIEVAIKEVNRIWSAADIQWKLLRVEDRRVSEIDFPKLGGNEEREEIRKRLQMASPPLSNDRVWRVALIREMPVPSGGLYLPDAQTVYFADVTRGGKTSAVILAHELGHSLGLPHDLQESNLMHRAAGARRDIIGSDKMENATALTTEQISTARSQAILGPRNSPMAKLDEHEGEHTNNGSTQQPRGHARSGGTDMSQRKQRMAARIRSFDKNDDGVILIDDVPEAGRATFRRIDTDHNDKITDAELNEFQH